MKKDIKTDGHNNQAQGRALTGIKMKKETRGRPKLEKGKQHRRNVTLSDRLIKKAKQIGQGNISEGIRRALEAYSG